MSISEAILKHKTGKFGVVYHIGLPWVACSNDDEIIQYINYCFEVIKINIDRIESLSFFNEDGFSEIVKLISEIKGAHNRISSCHKVLSGKLSPVMTKHVNHVYTGKLSQGK